MKDANEIAPETLIPSEENPLIVHTISPTGMDFVFVEVTSDVPQTEWDIEDQGDVQLGLYEISVPSSLPDGLKAKAALDSFHDHVAIACLDDFNIRVVKDPNDPESTIVEEDERDQALLENSSAKAEFFGWVSPVPVRQPTPTDTNEHQPG